MQYILETKKLGCRKSEISKNLNISLRSIQNWEAKGIKDNRKGSVKVIPNKLCDAEVNKILKTSCSDRFKNLTPYEIVPILAEEGRYLASESTFYRVLRKEGLIKQKKKTRRCKVQGVEIKATGANQIWSWDITYLTTAVRGQYLYLYLFMDIWSRAIIGWEIHEIESGQLASKMMERLCKEHGVEKDILLLHSDNGGPMKNGTMLATLQMLGVTSSFSRPSVSNDNAYSESLFKTLKYTAGYPKHFDGIESAISWVTNFVKWYNFEHRHSKIGYVTPIQRHTGKDKIILARRQIVYKKAQMENQNRWTKNCKQWDWSKDVYLKKGNFIRK